jgi:lysophospholipase L1-like esterase
MVKKVNRQVKNILCFGDSNTYGLKPDGSGRYDFDVRYPGQLQAFLGGEFHIIEEGCPGRTTIYEDLTRPYKKGIDYIAPCLQSHTPLDWVIIMLGTNDCKTAFQASSHAIARGLSRIIDAVKVTVEPSTQIMIVAPIHLGEAIGQPDYDPEFDDHSRSVSRGLSKAYKLLAQQTGCAFVDVSTVAKASSIDQEHLDAAGHLALAKLVASSIQCFSRELQISPANSTAAEAISDRHLQKSRCAQKSG